VLEFVETLLLKLLEYRVLLLGSLSLPQSLQYTDYPYLSAGLKNKVLEFVEALLLKLLEYRVLL
jgi:hypothetical protein